ncbi:MAG: galactose mutarotase [Eubacterium sp.]|nr:galactose mutarotase [Eubacterium sp.]
MSVSKKEWGDYCGYKIYLYTIKSKEILVNITNYGAALVNIFTPDKNGNIDDIILGYDDLAGYINGKTFQGATIGRYANRIGGSVFKLYDVIYNLPANDNGNCLHGGFFGYNNRIWEIGCIGENSVTMKYKSPDGECGFPGAVNIEVSFSVVNDNGLHIYYKAVPNSDTILNLTNHSYFNLGGFDSGDVLDTDLIINADSYTPVDDKLIPTGEIRSVKGTPFDFTEIKKIGRDIKSGLIDGYDHNFVFSSNSEKMAYACHGKSGRTMEVFTDMPAIQLYTGNGLDETGKSGSKVNKFGGFCLETQFSPDTPNKNNFPTCVFKAGEEYNYFTKYIFGVK